MQHSDYTKDKLHKSDLPAEKVIEMLNNIKVVENSLSNEEILALDIAIDAVKTVARLPEIEERIGRLRAMQLEAATGEKTILSMDAETYEHGAYVLQNAIDIVNLVIKGC